MIETHDDKITVIGAGSWGTTLAWMLGDKGLDVNLWDIDTDLLQTLATTHRHFRIPAISLPQNVTITENISDALNDRNIIVIAVPSRAFRSCCRTLRKARTLKTDTFIVVCTKGIEPGSGSTMSSIVMEELGAETKDRICVLSGPSHAEEVSRKMPTVVVAASFTEETSTRIQSLFMTPFFRPYRQSDILGVEVGGAVKNVIAIAAGMCDGLGYGDNTKAALLTRGLAEIIRLGVSMGANVETFTGLSGVGDLIVTATSHHSRNRNFGELIAQGLTVDAATTQIGMVVEGITTAESVIQIARRFEVDMPISQGVYEVVYEGKDPHITAKELMLREPKPEIYGF